MTLLNLYQVTEALMELLRLNITINLAPFLDPVTNEEGLTVTALPPERVVELVGNPTNTLSLFLYHVIEDSYYKNILGSGSDVPNIANAPMALNLFYILTAHHEVGEVTPEFDVEAQQRLMGFALKTFHDFPVITDQTEIGGETILKDDTEMTVGLRGKGNTLQVIMRPVSPEEAITFWSAEETRTARLSAYYEVRVVMLEPEPPQTMPGIVLNLGTFLVQIGSPHLERSQSLVHFELPLRNRGPLPPPQIEASPARVTLNDPFSPPETLNQLLLLGTNLTAGRSRSLVLKNRIWDNLLMPIPGNPTEFIVPDWPIEFASDLIAVTLNSPVIHERPDASTIPLPVLPGFYSVFVRSILEEKVINNELKQIFVTSNEIGFVVAPLIVGNETLVAGNIQIDLGFDPLDTNFPADAIQVIVAGQVYTRVPASPTNVEEFFVTNSPNRITLNPHVPVTEPIPFRLIVNGAESAPFWIDL